MNTTNEDYLTPEALELIARAKALAPKLAERACAADRDGRVSEETIAEMAAAGLFRILQPRRWGGYELDPRVFYTVQMALAEGCMSTAWMYGVVGVHPWQLSLFPEQAQQDVWHEDSGIRIASTYMPTGKAEPVEGGYKFSGRWGFSTGIEHCDWVFLGGLLPKKDGSGALEHATFLLPKADVKVEENWDVLGLRGTGSHDIVIGSAFVPEHRIHRTNDHSDAGCPGRATNPGWLYRVPFTQVFQRAVSSACIGALEGAITSFRERSASHVGKHGNKMAEDPNAQMAVTEAMMAADQLRLVLFRNYARIVHCAKTGEKMPVEERLMQRAQASAVPKITGERVNDLMRACAASGTYKTNPIERIFRDIHQGRGHIANNTDAYARAHGGVMLGLPNMDAFV
ncbi:MULTISPECIES: acyl-CoA dehydrogenase family protein [Comamonadaceae]|uniref:acyl-CoA dehydrogenase family protein n=1 Tax=Comamonadaceae TaxID=80864 RepID=UPI0027236992|nr:MULTISPECIES: acyl-CoA dehydrogenase family protein [Comamonadaceae]MDO9143495.1 acyl-CoA dehydrogenase family protein [Rhodoferax sp.]MDP3884978.1 acyl-CoA dehydrogenase family protein [Hydrogenophaga sp.]